jgi:hypothetical protein
MAVGRAIPEGFDHAIAQHDRIATAFLRQGDDALCHQQHGWVAAVDQSELPKGGLKCRCQGPDVVRPKRSCLRFQERPNRHEEQPRKPGIASLTWNRDSGRTKVPGRVRDSGENNEDGSPGLWPTRYVGHRVDKSR